MYEILGDRALILGPVFVIGGERLAEEDQAARILKKLFLGCHSNFRRFVLFATAREINEVGRKMMRVVALNGTMVVILSTAANLLHGFAHQGQQVMSFPAWQWAYILSVIYVAPVVAAALLWTRYQRVGAWLLFASMAGSLVFGLAYHFLIPGADNAFTLQPGAWRTTFQVSAALVLLLQAIGSVVGVWALNVLSSFRTIGSTAGLSSTWQDPRKESR